MQAPRVAGASGAAAADLSMLRMSDPRLADESEIEPIVFVCVCVWGSQAAFPGRLQAATCSSVGQLVNRPCSRSLLG